MCGFVSDCLSLVTHLDQHGRRTQRVDLVLFALTLRRLIARLTAVTKIGIGTGEKHVGAQSARQ